MVQRRCPAGVGVSPADVLPDILPPQPQPLVASRRERQPGPGLDILQDLLVVLIVASQGQVGVLRPLPPRPGGVGPQVLAGLPAGLLEDADQVAHSAGHCHTVTLSHCHTVSDL